MIAVRRNRRTLGALVLGGALVVGAPGARADGVVISPLDLDPAVRAQLAAEIAAARASDGAAFDALAAIDSYKPEGIRRSRHNQPSAARALMRLGRPGLWPMIEWTAFRAERGKLSDDQWRVLGAGLLQALGVLKDARAAPVLRAALAKAREPVWLDRAAEGLGMLCGEAEERLLLAASGRRGDRRAAAIAGLGHCRTHGSARRLAAILRGEPPDSDLAARATRALGYVGSSWALAADTRVRAEDAEAIRRTAVEALVEALPRQTASSTRAATARSVLMVEHPLALERLAVASRGTSGDVLDDIERLRRTLERKLARP